MEKQKGAAAIELALCAPFLTMLYFGMVELGNLIHTVSLMNQVAEQISLNMSRRYELEEGQFRDLTYPPTVCGYTKNGKPIKDCSIQAEMQQQVIRLVDALTLVPTDSDFHVVTALFPELPAHLVPTYGRPSAKRVAEAVYVRIGFNYSGFNGALNLALNATAVAPYLMRDLQSDGDSAPPVANPGGTHAPKY